MITALLSIFGSSAFGSLLGGVFAFLNRKTDLEAKRLDQLHEQAKWANDLAIKDKDLEYARVEAQGRKDVAVVEGDATVEAARMNAIAATQAADQVRADEITAAGKMGWMLVLALALNKFIRPVATTILCAAAVYINWLLVDKLVGSWPTLAPDKQYDAAMQAFAWITGQAGAVLGYWFVSRGTGK